MVFLMSLQSIPLFFTLQPDSPIAFLAFTQKVYSFSCGQNLAQVLTCMMLRCLFCRIPGLPDKNQKGLEVIVIQINQNIYEI